MAGGPTNYTRKDPAKRIEQAAIVYDLKLQGLSYREIDVLTQDPNGPTGGHRLAATTVKELLYFEYERRVDPKVDMWRQIQMDRLEGVLRGHLALRDAHWDRAMGSSEAAPEVAAALAVDRALNGVVKVIGEQNKLLGIATTKIEATVTEVTQQDLELQDMINELKAKNAAVADQLRGAREHPQ